MVNFQPNNDTLYRSRRLKEWSKKFYFFALVLFLSALFFKSTLFIPEWFSYSIVYKVIQFATVLVLFRIFVLEQSTIYVKGLIFAFAGALFALGYASKNYDIFYYSLFIIGANNINYQKILKVFLQTNGVLILMTILAAGFRVIPNQLQGRIGHPEIIRYSMGFLTPTDFGARIFYFILAYFVYKEFKLRWQTYCCVLACTALLFYITNARLDTLLIIFLTLVAYFYPTIKKVCLHVDYLGYFGLGILYIGINLAIAYFYSPSNRVLTAIDRLLSGRLRYGYQALHEHGISIFGQFIQEHGNGSLGQEAKTFKYFYVDSSFIRLIVMQGIVVFIMYLLVLMILFRKFTEQELFFMVVYILLVLLSSAIDQHLLDASYNVVLLALFADFKRKNLGLQGGVKST
ncbi:hypothetical protein LPAF129_06930 [Ligilactobacillus pabuli]|uniref:Polymerase n=1 Tax=Ligilactobacillus pabuli TaxID=2886039 RepID=A0ABQ5JG11_9LACO|nr:hypothetical protein [Ligilactobacillus pabuli]GKS81008.1 hypothetical protein LPAF129_06930 [Ligilactobacillus pabuli]